MEDQKLYLEQLEDKDILDVTICMEKLAAKKLKKTTSQSSNGELLTPLKLKNDTIKTKEGLSQPSVNQIYQHINGC